MARPLAHVPLDPGAVYRTAWLRRWGANPTRLAQKLEDRGLVRRLGHGLLYAPRTGRFGEVPPSDEALLNAFLDGTAYVITGPLRWNALGLGSTAVSGHARIYNTKRSGTLQFGGRTFDLRREAFPAEPTAEWFVIDLLRHADEAGVDRDDLTENLAQALRRGRFDNERLLRAAEQFGRRQEIDAVQRAVAQARSTSPLVSTTGPDKRQDETEGDMTHTGAIQSRIQDHGPGWVFTPADFVDLAARPTVDQALSRLARRDVIRRLDRGVYDVPRTHPRLGRLWPAADAVARAVASSTDSQLLPSGATAANALGLTTQVPARADYVTDGRPRRVRVGNLDVHLGRASRLDLLLPSTRAGAALSALHHLGRTGVTDAVVHRLTALLDDADKRLLLTVRRKVAAWLAAVIDRVAAGLGP
jgi:hypothetical protein